MTETAGRGPDTFAIALDGWREAVQAIEAAGAVIATEYERLERLVVTLSADYGTVPTHKWAPHVRAALAELRRRQEPDVEGILPESLKAVV